VVYDKIIHAWFDVDEPGQAWSVLERAEVAIATIPYEFYMSQAAYCIADYQSEVVRPWLERAVEKAPPNVPLFAAIGEMAMMAGDFEIGREYLERAIEAKQQPGQAYLMLGILAAKEGDNRAAERHWREAERIACRNRDRELSERIEMARFISTAPPEVVNLMLGLGRGPSGGIPFPDFFDDEYDDDDDFYY
jgi:tetratricopeptide (TPR) repeat protein